MLGWMENPGVKEHFTSLFKLRSFATIGAGDAERTCDGDDDDDDDDDLLYGAGETLGLLIGVILNFRSVSCARSNDGVFLMIRPRICLFLSCVVPPLTSASSCGD